VSVTPDSVSFRVAPSDSGFQFFQVHNNGGGAATYGYSASCISANGLFSPASRCAVSGQTTPINPGDSASIQVPYKVASSLSLSGSMRLDVWDVADTTIKAHGIKVMTTASISPVVVSVRDVGASTTIARDQCLTFGAGTGAAYECGDLRLVHALPTTT